MMNLNTIKFVTSTIVGLGTSRIVTTVIKNNVNPQTTIDVITVTAGSVVIGGMVADATKQYTDKTIDEIAEAVQSFKNASTKN